MVLRHGLDPFVEARNVEWSMVSSAVDLHPRPSDGLIRFVLEIAEVALGSTLSSTPDAASPGAEDAELVNLWPGEHYRLLAALTSVLGGTAVEVGTFRGTGALALREGGARVVTYDIVPRHRIPGTWLRGDEDGIEQRVGDLSQPEFFSSNVDTLESASLVFVDGPKDGAFERRFTELLLASEPHGPQYLVFDDIRLMTMVSFWRELELNKMDITSLGHTSGTGIALRE